MYLVLNCTYIYMCVCMCVCVDFLRDSETFSFYHVGMLQNCRVLYSLYSLCQGKSTNKTNAILNDRLSCRRSFFKTLRTLLAACIHHASAARPPGHRAHRLKVLKKKNENKMNISSLRLKLVVYSYELVTALWPFQYLNQKSD